MNYKQAIIIRNDIGMSKGKIAVQACHASLLSAFDMYKKNHILFEKWVGEGMKKIVLKIDSKEELMNIKKKAGSIGITVRIINDAGLTELNPGTTTALGIGPDKEEKIDKVINDLKLL